MEVSPFCLVDPFLRLLLHLLKSYFAAASRARHLSKCFCWRGYREVIDWGKSAIAIGTNMSRFFEVLFKLFLQLPSGFHEKEII